MRTLSALANVLRDLVWLTIVQPVREGRPRAKNWPVGLRPIVGATLALYVLLALAVVFAGRLRGMGDLVITSSGASLPALGTWLAISGAVLSLALLVAAALHLPWWVKAAAFLVVMPVLSSLLTGVLTQPVLLVPAGVAVLFLIVLFIVRARARYAWWEFVAVTGALVGGIFVPLMRNDATTILNIDWRGYVVEGAILQLQNAAIPSLYVAGAALAQITVTASFAGVAAAERELSRGAVRVVAVLVTIWAGFEIVRLAGDPENAGSGWLGSLLAVLATSVLTAGVMRVAGRPPAWSDLNEDSTALNYAIGVGAILLLLINPLLIWLHALTRFTGPDWLHQALDVSTTTILGQQTLPVSRIAAGVVGLAVTLRLARRGRPWAAMFCSAVTVLAVFQLLRTSGYAAWTDVSPTQLAGVLLVVSLTVTVVLLLRRQLTGLRAMALASATLVCLIYPHRAILDDPISALLGFSGVAVVLFGLVWRLLTEGEITQHHTDRWPLPARVLLFCASALLGVTVTAFVTLSRGTGYVIDPARLADGGDFLLGTPLLVTAVIGCLAIALAPRRASSDRPGSGGAAQPAGTVSGAVGRPGY